MGVFEIVGFLFKVAAALVIFFFILGFIGMIFGAIVKFFEWIEDLIS